MMNIKLRKIFIRALLVLTLIGGITILLDLLIHYPPFQQYLIRQISETARYDIQAGKIRIGFLDGLGVHISTLTARSRNAAFAISADSVDISFEYRALINRQLIPARAFVKDARITINPRQKEAGPVPAGTDQLLALEPAIGTLFGGFKRVTLKNASLALTGSDYRVKHLNATVRETGTGRDGREIDLEGLFEIANTATRFQWKGSVFRSPDDGMGNDGDGGGHFLTRSTLIVTDLPLAHLPWPRKVPFESGHATGQFSISGTLGADMTVNGQLSADRLHFSVVNGGRTKTYHIPHTDINMTGRLGNQTLQIEKLTCQLPDTSISLAMGLNWHGDAPSELDLDIHSTPMPLAVFKRIFPTPLVSKWIEGRLFPLFSDGTARLGRFRLNGSIDQIKALGHPENADVLELRLTLGGLTALAGNAGIPVTRVGGKVAIAGGQLLITDVNGHFGQSDLRRVTMTWPDLYGKSDAFHIGIQGDFRLADLKRQSKQPLLPAVIRREIDQVGTARGQLAADIVLFFPDHQHPPTMKGVMTVKAGRITHAALPLPLELSRTRLTFNGNKPIQIAGTGRWGRSDVETSGTFGLPWSTGKSNPIPIDLDIDTDADLSDLLVIRKWPALPVNFRTACSGIQTVAGRVAARFHVSRAASIHAQTQITGTFTASHVSLVHEDLLLPLDIQDGRLEITDSGQGHFKAAGQWGQSSFNADGSLASLGKNLEISLSAYADTSEILLKACALKPPPVTFNESLHSLVQISKTDTHWAFSGEIELNEILIRLPSLTLSPAGKDNRLTFTAAYTPATGVTFDRFRFFKNNFQIDIKDAGAGISNGALSFDISADHFLLKNLGLLIQANQPGKTRPVSGMVTGHLTGNLPVAQPAAVRLNGNLTATALKLSKTADAPRYNADLRFEDKRIDIASLTFPLGGNEATLKGHLTRDDHWQGHLTLYADSVDVPRLIRQYRYAQSPGTGNIETRQDSGFQVPGFLSGSDLDLLITVRETIWEGINLGLLQASVRYQDPILSISKAVLTAPDSLIKISGTVAGRDRAGISLLTYIKINNKPLATLLNGFDIRTDRIKGTTSLEGGLFFGGRETAEIIQNLAGKFNIQITDGEIKKSSVILNILKFLSIQNIFAQKPPNMLQDHFYFKSIQGHILVQKGVLRADRLFMKSPVFNAAVKGSLDLPKNHLQIALGVQPLNTVDLIVSKIPIIGHILAGKEKTILVYYFKVRGPLENPTLKQVPFNNLGNALTGYFKRLFLTPARILLKISDTLGDIGKDIQSGNHPPVQNSER